MKVHGFKRVLALTTVMLAPFMMAKTAEAQEWNGLYVGGNVGFAIGDGETQFEPLPDAATFVNMRPTSLDSEPQGGLYGVQIGYNFDPAGPFVFGVEADIQGSNIDGDDRRQPIIQNNGTAFGTTTFQRAGQTTNWFATIRARLGLELSENALVYVTGGGAWASTDYYATSEFRPTGTVDYTADFSETQGGWAAGGGLEMRVPETPWSIRAEYLYTDVGSTDRTVDANPVNPPFQVRYEWENTQQAFRFGVNYQF